MAVEASGDLDLLCSSDFGEDDGRVTLKQHPTLEKNQGHSEVRKRALDDSKSSHPSVKKLKLSSYHDDDIDELPSLERNIEEWAIELQNMLKHIRKVNEVYKKVQKKIEDCVCNFVYMETLHSLMEDLIREGEVQLKTKEVEVHQVMHNINKEREEKEEELEVLGQKTAQCTKELKIKEEELDAIKKLIDGQAKELESERKTLLKVISTKVFQLKGIELMRNQLEGRIKELDLIHEEFEGKVNEFKLKEEEFERQVKEVKSNLGSQSKDLESKTKQVEVQLEELKSRAKQLKGQENELEGKVKEFKLKECQVKEVESNLGSQSKDLESKRKQVDVQLEELKSRAKQLKGQENELEGKVKEFRLKECQVKEVESNLGSQSKDLESKRKQVDVQLEELQSREKQLKVQEKELESKNKQFESQLKEFELRKEKFESQVKEHELKERSEKQYEIPVRSFKDENEWDEPESLDNGILVNLEATSDPSKIVLDIIQKPIVPKFENEDDAVIMETFLLEQLLKISPHIKPQVRGEAMNLALELKGNMRSSSENSLEVLRFLLVLSIYGLVPFFDEEEVSKLFANSSDFVQNLVKKQQHIEAVRFICAFKWADKNQPVDLLREYAKNAKLISESSCKNTTSRQIQDKASAQEIAALTNVLLCISDNNLESVGLLNEIEDRIIELNRKKAIAYSGTWPILQMCNNLRKRNVGLKYGGRMESSESKSAAVVSNGEDPHEQQLGFEPSPLAHHQSSDLNHAAEEDARGGKLQNKLDLKGADEGGAETGKKVSNFNDNDEPCKGEECDGDENVNEERRGRTPHCPLRPDSECCVLYVKTGSCMFGSSCRFKHPIKENPGEPREVCKHYQKYGVCKFGKACWYSHTGGNSSERSMNNPAIKSKSVEEDFPERSGEPNHPIKEKPGEPTEVCKNYQRFGVCKYGKACRYIHTKGNSSERSLNNQAIETSVKQMSVEEEFPDRPGEPEGRDFLKFGVCKFKSDCKFHHPKLPRCNLGNKGLPPRPDQNGCSHYSCKFAPACKYDNP